MVACPRISSTASSITRLTALQRRHQAWHGGLPHLSTVMGNTCCRSQQIACLSEFWLFIVSHKLRRKNGEAPSSSSTTTGWAMIMMMIPFLLRAMQGTYVNTIFKVFSIPRPREFVKGLKFQVWNRSLSLTQQICNYGYYFLTIVLQIPEQDLSCRLFKLIFVYEESKRKWSFF